MKFSATASKNTLFAQQTKSGFNMKSMPALGVSSVVAKVPTHPKKEPQTSSDTVKMGNSLQFLTVDSEAEPVMSKRSRSHQSQHKN